MKYQLIPAVALAALMVWCGFRIAQSHPPIDRQAQPAITAPVTP